jgi:5-methylcytosine-specific restriction endonuclease McrA
MSTSNLTTSPKRCHTCDGEFPATAEYFHRDSQKADGLNVSCKSCRCAVARRSRLQHPDNARESHKAYRQRNRDKTRAWKRADYARHKADRLAIAAKYHAEHPKIRKKATSNYRNRHRDRTREASRRWLKANPDKHRATEHRRRARKLSAEGSHTPADVERQYNAQRGKCYWCGKKVGKTYHVDHVIPLDRGGSNGPDNLVIACAPCNLSKNNKLPHEWNGANGKLL